MAANKLQAIGYLIADTRKARSTYRGTADAWRSLTLRAAVGSWGRRVLPNATVPIRTASSPHYFYLRRHSSDFQIFASIFERRDYDVVDQLRLGERPLIVDAGGNVGLAVRRFEDSYPDATFVSIEPDQENLAAHRRNNAHLIASGQLRYVEGFLAVSDGTASIDRSGAASEYRIIEDGPGSIPTFSMPRILADYPGRTVDLLKIDIEGYESRIVKGAAPWIRRVRYLLIEIDPPYTFGEFISDVTAVAGAAPRVIWHKNELACIEVL